ncbi:hypothetical protein CKO28_04740 [Rhodovibrio sodomensis]|uniref:PABS domain-containing protein n=1 Tax=Rhodovibrio sodomensis TaxID=1088 RepID=A0ABS1DAF0_9PROT|nr:hypothetical protein [Rhodovibrio sodomensis]MBK1667335.1 hypothetical protein [Rhodovibrio sodomensis]
MRRSLLLLAAVSGICGIAYEVLLGRMISSYLGHTYLVSAAVLAGFMIGLALGNLLAHRALRWLPLVEIGIGAYGISAAVLFRHGFEEVVGLLPASAAGPGLVAMALVMVSVPALLIGLAVPLFALHLERQMPDTAGSPRARAFQNIYITYNLAAAAGALALEFLVVRTIGLSGAMIALAVTNVAVGAALWYLGPNRDTLAQLASAGTRPDGYARLALFTAALASGVYQMLVLKLTALVFGPAGQNLALVVAIALLGLAAGSWLSRWRRLSFSALLASAVLILPLGLLTLRPAIELWSEFASLDMPEAALLGGQFLVLLVVTLPGFILLGATVPVILRCYPGTDATPGRGLAIASLGNGIGFLATALLLHAWLGAAGLAVLTVLLLVTATWPLTLRRGHLIWPVAATAIAGGMAALLLTSWPHTYLAMGASELARRDLEQRMTHIVDVKTLRSFDNTVSLVTHKHGFIRMVINGHGALGLGVDGRDPEETMVGMAPALFSDSHEHALVLGLGTGITASAVSETYTKVTIVDSNPLAAEMLPRFDAGNMGLAEQTDLDVRTQDGFVHLLQSGSSYDAIVNTVDSPAHMAAAKLYSLDFLRLASRHLTPGGVYATWFDSSMPLEARHSLILGLKTAFADCSYLMVNSGYSLAICGNSHLGAPASDVPFSDRLRNQLRSLGVDQRAEVFLGYRIAVRHPLGKPPEGTPVSTLDNPELDFLMGRPGADDDFSQPSWHVRQRQLFSRPRPDELEACYAQSLLSWNSPCMEALQQRRCIPDMWLARLARSLTPLPDMVSQVVEIATALHGRGHPDLARELLRAVDEVQVRHALYPIDYHTRVQHYALTRVLAMPEPSWIERVADPAAVRAAAADRAKHARILASQAYETSGYIYKLPMTACPASEPIH